MNWCAALVTCHHSIKPVLSLICGVGKAMLLENYYMLFFWTLEVRTLRGMMNPIARIRPKYPHLCPWVVSVNCSSNCSWLCGFNWFSISPFLSKITEGTNCVFFANCNFPLQKHWNSGWLAYKYWLSNNVCGVFTQRTLYSFSYPTSYSMPGAHTLQYCCTPIHNALGLRLILRCIIL